MYDIPDTSHDIRQNKLWFENPPYHSTFDNYQIYGAYSVDIGISKTENTDTYTPKISLALPLPARGSKCKLF